MRYQAGFHRVVPLCRVGCIRVTHPSAGRRQRYCYRRVAPRLACVKPVASVHPEPGSNSSLYIFFLFFSFSLYKIVSCSAWRGRRNYSSCLLPESSFRKAQVPYLLRLCCLSFLGFHHASNDLFGLFRPLSHPSFFGLRMQRYCAKTYCASILRIFLLLFFNNSVDNVVNNLFIYWYSICCIDMLYTTIVKHILWYKYEKSIFWKIHLQKNITFSLNHGLRESPMKSISERHYPKKQGITEKQQHLQYPWYDRTLNIYFATKPASSKDIYGECIYNELQHSRIEPRKGMTFKIGPYPRIGQNREGR